MKNHISIGISKGDDMPNIIKNFLLYLVVCGFPRLFAMAWPAIVTGLERLLTRKTPPPRREEKAEAKALPNPKKRSKKRNRRSQPNPRGGR
jgi:hypothetical protein